MFRSSGQGRRQRASAHRTPSSISRTREPGDIPVPAVIARKNVPTGENAENLPPTPSGTGSSDSPKNGRFRCISNSGLPPYGSVVATIWLFQSFTA